MGINMSKLKFNQLAVISLLTLGVTACGGSGGGSKVKVYSGVFKDSNVQGLHYASGGQEGTTGKNGEFKYEENSAVSFSVGGVNLGSASAKNVMTPKNLVKNGKEDASAVLNRLRFLVMLDKDNQLGNGIKISSEVLKVAKKKWTTVDFKLKPKDFQLNDKIQDIRLDASLADKNRHNIPTEDQAKSYLKNTLDAIIETLSCIDSGAFVGSYKGSEAGKVGFIVTPQPETREAIVIGSLHKSGSPVGITKPTGKISYSNDNARKFVTETESGTVFTGVLSSGNKLEGTWKNKDQKGTFVAKRLEGNSGAKHRYTSTYQSDDLEHMGLVAFDKKSNGDLTGKIFNVRLNETLDIKGKLKDGKFNNVTFKGGEITGKVGEGRTGTITHDKTTIPDFTFKMKSGCKLN